MKFKNTEKKITQEDLNLFLLEKDLTLPNSYKSYILKNNGGKPEKEFISGIKIHYFHPIKYGKYSLEEVLIDFKDVLPKGFFPFADDGGGNPLCISTNEEDFGKIYIYFTDDGQIDFLASSFEELINGLTENDDD